MTHPDEDPELPGKPRRRPSHFRKKRLDTTTKVVRVLRERSATPSDPGHVVQSRRSRQEQWRDVINPAPALPDPLLQRPLPPPAPLPSEKSSLPDLAAPGWLDDRHQRKRVEDLIGTVGLALMVAAMLVAMWLRMTGN
ncbi:MAG TPA: hypothetical protein VFG22_00520 [Polyangiales bacterium]|nr:hypothetical protein [Polyangiales bacterium]